MLRIATFVLLCLYGPFACAIDIIINVESDATYEATIEAARAHLGNPAQEIQVAPAANRTIYRLPPDALRVPVYVEIAGLGAASSDVVFVLDSASLYVVGFRVNSAPGQAGASNYYRFRDIRAMANEAPGATRTDLTADSSYTGLTRIAGVSRDLIPFSRNALANDMVSLRNHVGQNLNAAEARALLRYITVISEAMRFRVIQRPLAAIFSEMSPVYNLPANLIRLTLNWADWSEAVAALIRDNRLLNQSVRVDVGEAGGSARGDRIPLVISLAKFCDLPPKNDREELRRRRRSVEEVRLVDDFCGAKIYSNKRHYVVGRLPWWYM